MEKDLENIKESEAFHMLGNLTISDITQEAAKKLVSDNEARYMSFGYDAKYLLIYGDNIYYKCYDKYVFLTPSQEYYERKQDDK